jgi:hypothetical protein
MSFSREIRIGLSLGIAAGVTLGELVSPLAIILRDPHSPLPVRTALRWLRAYPLVVTARAPTTVTRSGRASRR